MNYCHWMCAVSWCTQGNIDTLWYINLNSNPTAHRSSLSTKVKQKKKSCTRLLTLVCCSGNFSCGFFLFEITMRYSILYFLSVFIWCVCLKHFFSCFSHTLYGWIWTLSYCTTRIYMSVHFGIISFVDNIIS